MTTKEPLISVLVCNYNYDQYIEETLDSILLQQYRNIEIVIIDDGSKDKSADIINKFVEKNRERRVVTKLKKVNEGLCYSRNDAIELASGEYILFLDSDDTMPVDYIYNMFTVSVSEGADVVYGDVIKFGDEIGKTNYPKYNSDELLLHNFINISSLVKKAKIGIHRFDESLNRQTLEDYDFWLGLSLMGLRFYKAENTYLNYRVQSDSRNENEATLDERITLFVNIWEYSINKYRAMYPRKVPNDIVFTELRYQIKQIGGELNRLNQIVQSELLPELGKRQDHIVSQEKTITDLSVKHRNLENETKWFYDSKWYHAAHKLHILSKRFKR